MTGLTLRAGGVEDLPDVMRIMSAAFDPHFGEAWSEAQCFAMIAATGCSLIIAQSTEAVGFALSRTIFDTCELMLLAVLPQAQHGGTGRQLLDHVVRTARDAEATMVFLEMREGNCASHLYSSLGFKQIGRRKNYYRGAHGELLDALTYQFLLS